MAKEKAPKLAKVIPIKPAIETLCKALCATCAESDFSGFAEIHIVWNGNEFELQYEEYDAADESGDVESEAAE